jgi:hypothetical protein
MLMAYEYLLFEYLLSQGLSQEEIKETNVLHKLKMANKFLRFIPSNMTNDTLRESVRNPLFHQGDIPSLTLEKKIEIFKSYYDLMIRIILRILNYSGEYMSVITHSPSKP